MRAAIYCRLSEEDRDKLFDHDESASIRNQKTMLVSFAERSGWVVHDIYSDDNYSGSDRSRPAFNRLIHDASDGKFDIVLCKSQSRFTREMELVEKYIHGLFPRLGIRFVSVADHVDTDDRSNKKARQLSGLVNEWFLEDLSDNIRAVLTSRREQGFHIGAFAPYGYRKDPARKGHLIVDPEAAVIVREIFIMYLRGIGKTRISRILNERRIPNPTEYKRQRGIVTGKAAGNSTLWSGFAVSNILSNEVYLGNLVQRKCGTRSYKSREKISFKPDQWIVATDTHEPIIDRDIWEKVRQTSAMKASAGYSPAAGIFTGRLYCLSCGQRMKTVKNGRKRGFQCRTHSLSPDACGGAYLSLPKLQRIVTAQLRILNEAHLDRAQLEAGIDPFPERREQMARLESEIAEAQRRIADSHADARTLYLDKLRGRIRPEDYVSMLAPITAEREAWGKQISESSDQLEQIRRMIAEGMDPREIEDRYLESRDLTGEMVRILIDHILVGRRDPVTGYTPIEIHWNF